MRILCPILNIFYNSFYPIVQPLTLWDQGSRNHSKALVNKTSHLDNADFLIRLLYKYSYESLSLQYIIIVCLLLCFIFCVLFYYCMVRDMSNFLLNEYKWMAVKKTHMGLQNKTFFIPSLFLFLRFCRYGYATVTYLNLNFSDYEWRVVTFWSRDDTQQSSAMTGQLCWMTPHYIYVIVINCLLNRLV